MLELGEGTRQKLYWARKGFATLCDQALISGSNFFLTLTLAKLLGPANYGAYAVMFSVFLLAGNLHQALVLEPMSVFQPASYQEKRREYIGSVIWLHVLVSVILVVVFGIAAAVMALSGAAALSDATIGLAFAAPCILLLWSARSAAYLDFRPARAAMASGLYCAGMLVALALVKRAHLLTPKTTFLLMGWASLLASGVLLYYLKPILRTGVEPGVRELIRTHWDYGRWSMLGTVVMWLEVNSYYLTTGTFLGMREAGALAALASFALPINHIFQGTSRLLLPVFSKHANQHGREATRQLAGRLSMAFIAVVGIYALMASVFAKFTITLLYGPKFAEFARYVGPSLISVVLASAIVPKELAMRAIQAPRQLLRASACTGSLALVVGLTAIWTLGLPGVFVSTALTTSFHFCLVSYLLRRETRRDSATKGPLQLPVIAYHHVGPARPGILRSLTLSGRRFSSHMAWLSRFGYHSVTLDQVLAWMRGEQELPPKPVLITFDDAYEDLCSHALPVLERHNFHSVVFVVTGQIGGSNHFDQRTGCGPLRLMSADQIRQWATRSVEFGAHTRSHFDLTTAKGLELVDEVEGSRTDLEALLQRPVVSFAYPYGAFDSLVETQAAKSYQLVFTTRSGLNEQDTPAFRINRSITHHRDTALDILLRVTLGWSPVEVVREYMVRPLRPLFTPFRTPYLRGDTQDA